MLYAECYLLATPGRRRRSSSLMPWPLAGRNPVMPLLISPRNLLGEFATSAKWNRFESRLSTRPIGVFCISVHIRPSTLKVYTMEGGH